MKWFADYRSSRRSPRLMATDWKEKFAAADKTRQVAFASFVLRAASERVRRQARGEADPPQDF